MLFANRIYCIVSLLMSVIYISIVHILVTKKQEVYDVGSMDALQQNIGLVISTILE